MGADAFADLVAADDGPMVVVTTAVGGERAGCLVGFHSQSSIDPERYSVWLSKANHTYRVATRADHLAVHFLTDADHPIAELFGGSSGDDVDKFERTATEPGPDGVPLLADCPHRLVGRRVTLFDDGGDHVCVTLEVLSATTPGPFDPLRLSDVADLTPGHDAEERPHPPTERADPDA